MTWYILIAAAAAWWWYQSGGLSSLLSIHGNFADLTGNPTSSPTTNTDGITAPPGLSTPVNTSTWADPYASGEIPTPIAPARPNGDGGGDGEDGDP